MTSVLTSLGWQEYNIPVNKNDMPPIKSWEAYYTLDLDLNFAFDLSFSYYCECNFHGKIAPKLEGTE